MFVAALENWALGVLLSSGLIPDEVSSKYWPLESYAAGPVFYRIWFGAEEPV